MANELFQARLRKNFAEEIHDYKDKRHMNKSEAVRALLRAGLEAETENNQDDTPDNPLERLASQWTVLLGAFVLMLGGTLLAAGSVLAQSGSTTIGIATAAFASTTIGVGVGLLLFAAVAQIALARPLRDLVLDVKEAPSNE